jgi:hypothetical protein
VAVAVAVLTPTVAVRIQIALVQVVLAVAEMGAHLVMAEAPISTAQQVQQIPAEVEVELTLNQILEAMADQELS